MGSKYHFHRELSARSCSFSFLGCPFFSVSRNSFRDNLNYRGNNICITLHILLTCHIYTCIHFPLNSPPIHTATWHWAEFSVPYSRLRIWHLILRNSFSQSGGSLWVPIYLQEQDSENSLLMPDTDLFAAGHFEFTCFSLRILKQLHYHCVTLVTSWNVAWLTELSPATSLDNVDMELKGMAPGLGELPVH